MALIPLYVGVLGALSSSVMSSSLSTFCFGFLAVLSRGIGSLSFFLLRPSFVGVWFAVLGLIAILFVLLGACGCFAGPVVMGLCADVVGCDGTIVGVPGLPVCCFIAE